MLRQCSYLISDRPNCDPTADSKKLKVVIGMIKVYSEPSVRSLVVNLSILYLLLVVRVKECLKEATSNPGAVGEIHVVCASPA